MVCAALICGLISLVGLATEAGTAADSLLSVLTGAAVLLGVIGLALVAAGLMAD